MNIIDSPDAQHILYTELNMIKVANGFMFRKYRKSGIISEFD